MDDPSGDETEFRILRRCIQSIGESPVRRGKASVEIREVAFSADGYRSKAA
jgi:hypothetical protein